MIEYPDQRQLRVAKGYHQPVRIYREVRVAGAYASWSRYIHHQEANSDKYTHVAR